MTDAPGLGSTADGVGARRGARRVLKAPADLRLAALVLARAATDTGERTSLDDVLVTFGFDRAELQAEMDAELAAEP